MPTLHLTAQGKVTGLWGHAIVKGADGHAHPLKLGDVVRRGDVILTTQDGIVELTSDGSAVPVVITQASAAVAATVPVETAPTKPTASASRGEVDQVIEKLAQNDADAATAAGLTGGDGGEFLPGLRVGRISESLTPLGFDNNDDTAQALAETIAGANLLAAAGANIAPSAVDDSISGPENTTLPVVLRGIDSDGNVVSVTITSVPTGGTLLLADGSTIVSAGQTLTPAQAAGLLFQPAIDFVGQAAITFFVTDNQGATSSDATVSLNLVDTNPPPPPNQPPVAVNDSATTAEDTPASGNVLGNDSDPEGSTLTVTQFSLAGVTYAAGATAVVAGIGSLTLAANGAYVFTPATNYNGPVPVATYTVSDGAASVTATLTLSVSPVADVPVAAPDSVPAVEDQPVVFDPRGNDGNTGDTPLSITAIGGQPIAIGAPVVLPQGTVSLNADGTLTFTPNPNVNGPVVFDYTVSNGGATSTSQVTVNIAPVNDAPVAVDDLASTPMNTATTIAVLANDSDVEGNPLVVTAASVDPTLGTVTVNPNGTLAFNPANNFSGPVVIQYTISDGQGGVASAMVTVNVGPNTPPEGSDATVTLAEDASRSFSAADFSFTDADAGQSFANLRIDTLPAAGSLTLSGVAVTAGQLIAVADLGNLVFTPAANGNGTGYASFNFSVQDSAGAFDVAPNQITIDVSAVNDAPVAVATPASGNEDAAGIPVLLGGTDIDGNIASFTIGSLPANGVLLFGGVPVTIGQSISATAGSATLSFVPAANFNGNTTFDFTATDNEGAVSAQVTAAITVAPVNDAPVAVDDLASTPVNTATTISVLANDSDVDGDVLTVTAASVNSALGTVTINPNGTLAFTPAGNVSGPVLVNYTVSDGQGGFANATVTVNVGSNTPPAGSDANVVIAEDSSRSFSAGDFGFSDADAGQSFANVRIDALPGAGSLTLSGAPVDAGQVIAVADLGKLVFTPAPNSNGTGYASFSFSVQDSGGALDPAPNQITIDVTPVTDAAVIGGASTGATVEDTTLTTGGTLTVTDPDAGEAAFNPLTNIAGAHGTFSIDAAGVWAYTLNNTDPAVQALGAGQTLPNETFTVTTIDGTSQVVTVTITGTNDVPVAQGASIAVNEDAPLFFGSVSATDVDANAVLSFGLNGASPAGLTFNPNGSYTFDASNAAYQSLAAGQQQVLTVPYTVTDDQGATSTANLVITISGTNDAPIARSDEGSVTAAQTLVVTATNGVIQSTSVAAGRDTDVDGDALTVTKVSAGAGAPSTAVPNGGVTIAGTYGDLLLRSDGSYSYTASRADAVATGTQANDVFSYQVSDGHGDFATASLTLHVDGVTDTLTAAPPSTTPLATNLGLNGEYYGYNDFNPGPTSPNRRHSDDGTFGDINRVSDIEGIVNGRNAVISGASAPVTGTSTAALANTPDAIFVARSIDYGTSPTVNGVIGDNKNVAPGDSLAGVNSGNSQLYKFLTRINGNDALSLGVRQGTGDNDNLGGGPTSGLGRTTDAVVRITGEAYLSAGLYDIRVLAGDAFRLSLDGQVVAQFDNLQAPTTRVYTGVPIEGGMTPLELLYGESGSNAALRVEFKLSGSPDSSYQILGSESVPVYSDANAPLLSDLQDIIAGPTAGSYLIRTGSLLDGGSGNDTLSGSAARDVLIGGAGNDTLNGGAGDDLIRGGAGNDQLTGGAGHDVFRWSLGDGGTAGTPTRDVISDFDNTPHGGDVLDLRDLLVGESHAANTVALPASIGLTNALTITPHEGNLANYLHFSAVGGNTVVEISSTGGFSSSYTPAAVDQVITLTGLNLVGSFSNDHQVINDLLQRGKLVTD